MSDPSDSREKVEAALRPWGWTCGPEFWRKYHGDPWVFNLVNALTRTTAEVERLNNELKNAREVVIPELRSQINAYALTLRDLRDEIRG